VKARQGHYIQSVTSRPPCFQLPIAIDTNIDGWSMFERC